MSPEHAFRRVVEGYIEILRAVKELPPEIRPIVKPPKEALQTLQEYFGNPDRHKPCKPHKSKKPPLPDDMRKLGEPRKAAPPPAPGTYAHSVITPLYKLEVGQEASVLIKRRTDLTPMLGRYLPHRKFSAVAKGKHPLAAPGEPAIMMLVTREA